MSDDATDKRLTGSCQCGVIRYELMAPALDIYICHCTECRKQSASAFGISVIVRSRDFRLLRGEPARWSRLADSGRTIDCFYCRDCGSRLWHGDKEKLETISVKGGSLDEPPSLAAATHIWTDSKLDGVDIPQGVTTYRHEPQ